MAKSKVAMLGNLTGKPYIRLAGTALTTTTVDGQICFKKTDLETELNNNWYSLDISAEKWAIGESSTSQEEYASDDASYEILKEFVGSGMMISVDKATANYLEDTFHNQAIDIAFYNAKSTRAVIVYEVVCKINVKLATQDKATLKIEYKEKGDQETIQDTWTILELLTADNYPIVQTLQAEDDGVGTAGLLGKLDSLGTTSTSAVGTVSAAGFVMSKTNNPPTTADTVVTNARTTVGYVFEESVTAAAGTWYVRAYATNAAGTSYGQTLTMVTT